MALYCGIDLHSNNHMVVVIDELQDIDPGPIPLFASSTKANGSETN